MKKTEYSKSFANKFVPVMKTQLYWHEFRLFYVHCSTFYSQSYPFPNSLSISFPRKCCNKIADISNLKFFITSSSVSLDSMVFCLKKKLVSEYQDIKGRSFPFLSQSTAACCCPPMTWRYAHNCKEEPRSVSTASFQQPRHIRFWWRAPNCSI